MIFCDGGRLSISTCPMFPWLIESLPANLACERPIFSLKYFSRLPGVSVIMLNSLLIIIKSNY